MATRTSNIESRTELEQVISKKYAVTGKVFSQASAVLAAEIPQSDGSSLLIGFENHHGAPAIILMEKNAGNAHFLLESLKNNNYALTQAMRTAIKNRTLLEKELIGDESKTYNRNIVVTNVDHIMNISFNTSFSTEMLHKLFYSLLSGLTAIGQDSLSQSIKETMEAQYIELYQTA